MRPRRAGGGPRAAVVAAAAALAIAISGCAGGSGPRRTGTTKDSITLSTTPPTTAAASGRALFAGHCAICHSISGHPLRTQQGGDVGSLHMPRNEMVQLTAEMPVINRRLTAAEVQAVVNYMQALARRR